jgi:tetratricopeptide (TPR) repeat protein
MVPVCRTLVARFALALVLAAIAPGCKTEDGDGAGLSEADALKPYQGDGENQRDDLTKVPMSLWSPSQRRATAGYYFLVAEYMAMKDRDPRRALPVYEAAYSLDPNPFLGGKMLAAKSLTAQRDDALLEARKMVLLYPRDPRLRQLYGEMLMRGTEITAAIEQLEKCVELDPSSEACHVELVELYQQNKEPAKALVVAREFTKNVPGSVIGWSMLSRLYLTSSRPKDALVPARRAYEMQSQNPHLTQIYALTLQLNGKVKQAIAMYEQLYRLDPTDEELTARMVELYRELGNLEQALDLLNEMSRQQDKQESKGRPAIQIQKALVLWELKRFKEASELLSKLAADHPESDRLKYLAAIGLERVDKHAEALAAYEALPENSSFKFHGDFRRVVILQTLKKKPEALAAGQELIKHKRADADSYMLAAGTMADSERYDEAVETLAAGYEKFADRHRLLFMKGVYQEKAGDRDECIETMRQVIKRDPTNSSAYNYLGYLFAEKGENLDEAEALIKRALELKPDDGFYLDSLGWVYYQRGDYDQALPILEQALKLQPDEGVIMEHIGDVKKAKGDAKAARALYERALKGTLEAKDKERIEQKLKDG